MPPFATKEKSEILRHALQKLQRNTPITSIGPGSVARSLAETVVNEIGDLYAAMDYNTSMGLISTAQGRALDLLGQLYNIERKQLGPVATLDQTIGSFFFFIDTTHGFDITIPSGTTVFTDAENFIGEEYSYITTAEVTIAAGRVRAFVPIRPTFADSVFTAGRNTITQHNLGLIDGVEVKCTNPKPIAPQVGYETDDNYRSRIIKEVRTSAGGTNEAIRFAGLAIPGVREVRIRPIPYGLGSVEALVVAEEQQESASIVAEVIDKLDRVRPAGVRLFVREPDYAFFDLDASIVLRSDLNVEPSGTARRAQNGVLRYINTLLPGDTLVYTRLIQAILDASDAIADVSVNVMRVGGPEVLRRNYKPESDEQIVPGDIRISPSS
jgi:uncharacterized phage protein gp47/JayE